MGKIGIHMLRRGGQCPTTVRLPPTMAEIRGGDGGEREREEALAAEVWAAVQ